MKKTKKVSKTVEKNKQKSKNKTTTETNKKAKTSVKKVAVKVAKKATKTNPNKKTESKKAPKKKETERRATSLNEKAYKDFRNQTASQENVPEEEIVTVERRKIISAKTAGPKKALVKREKVVRRRQIDPTTCERDYTPEEIEFMGALDEYKRQSGRMFPTCSEILEVFRGLGYVKQEQQEEMEHSDINRVVLIADDTGNSSLLFGVEQSVVPNQTDSPPVTTPSIPLTNTQVEENTSVGQDYTHPFGLHHLDEK